MKVSRGDTETRLCVKNFSLLTCGDHTELNLSNCSMDVWWILHHADVSAVVGKLDLMKNDGGVAALDVTSPTDTLPKNTVWRGVGSLLPVKHL